MPEPVGVEGRPFKFPPAKGREVKVDVFNRLVAGLNLQGMADERRFQELEKSIEALGKRVKKLEEGTA